MTAPALFVQQPGIGAVSADNLNTYMQTCDNAAQLRAFTGNIGVQVFMRGTSAPNDGGQGTFWWNYTATSPVDDNGVTTIVPYGAGQGCWSRISLTSQRATFDSQPGNPTGPQSTSVYTMQGLGALITPVVSGNILAIFSGYIFNGADTAVGDGIGYRIMYGTGSAPSNGAALTGTQGSQTQSFVISAIASASECLVPFSTQTLIKSLTLATPYWFDLAAIAASAVGFILANLNISLAEI